MATKKKTVRHKISSSTNEVAEKATAVQQYGVRLVKGATYSLGDKKYLPGRVYAVTRAMRDHMVGSKYFIDCLPDDGGDTAQPLDVSTIHERRGTMGDRTSRNEGLVRDRAAREEAASRTRADVRAAASAEAKSLLDDQSSLSGRIDPAPRPSIVQDTSDEAVEV